MTEPSTSSVRAAPSHDDGGRRRLSRGSIAAASILAALAVAVLIPVLYTVATALGKPSGAEYGPAANDLFWAIRAAWELGLMPGSLINSIVTSLGAVILLWLVCSMAAYAFAFLRYPGRNLLFLLILATLLIPVQVIMFPLFVQFRTLDLVNTQIGLIIGFLVFGIPLTTFQFAAYFRTLPRETIDAARVDGASTVQTLFRVVLPMSRPILAVTGIINFVWTYNDILLPFLIIQDSEKKPLVAQLAIITQSQYFSSSLPALAAAALLGFAPTVIVYLLGQRQIVRGMVSGAIK